MSNYGSINEPEGSRQSFAPPSINEPPDLPEGPADGDKPVITSLEPPSCELGDPPFTLDVTGTGFTANSVIVMDGLDMTTTVNDEQTLSTPIDPVWWTAAGVIPTSVRTGLQTSDPADFTVTEAARAVHMSDPDELEEEIEEAEDEGEFKPVHASHHTKIERKKK